MNLWVARQKLRDSLHKYFRSDGFVEVDTPVLVGTPGTEVHLQYFDTEFSPSIGGAAKTLYLRSSPELHMKRILTQGLSKIYQIGPSFRNGAEYGDWHHPEFTMLEFYTNTPDYFIFMEQVIALLESIAREFDQDLSFKKMKLQAAFKEYADIDEGLSTLRAKSYLDRFPYLRQDDSHESTFFKILLNEIEPNLDSHLLYDYPDFGGTLAKSFEGISQRFEIYIDSIEVGNAFCEETDADQNRIVMESTSRKRSEFNYTKINVDEEFLTDLSRGLPACCGCALGFDRLLALLLGNSKSVAEFIPFRSDWSR